MVSRAPTIMKWVLCGFAFYSMCLRSVYEKMCVKLSMGWGTLGVYMMYSVGAITLPCGTPAYGVKGSERVLLYFMWMVLLVKYELISLRQ